MRTRFPVIQTLSERSDLYIYFYFHGLALLNKKGTFCFITSNSWLDVDYGKDLQHFLLHYVPIRAIYDNLAKRSFTQADINTIIALFDAPDLKNQNASLKNVAKFVIFRKPFEEAVKIKNLLGIETAREIISNENFRVYPIRQEDLLEEAMEYKSEEQKKLGVGKYISNKWGGKYLRAPDIFFTTLEKGRDKFEPLNKAGRVLIGLVTGANDFFMIDEKTINEYKLSENYLFPIIRTPKESKKIKIHRKDLNYKVLIANKLIDESLKKYIKLGEKRKLHNRPTCKARSPWFRLRQEPAPILFPYIIGERHLSYLNTDLVYTNRELERFIPDNKNLSETYCAFFNSTLIALLRELYGRTSLGGGALKLEVLDIQDFPVFKVKILESLNTKFKKLLEKLNKRPIKSIFEECGINPKRPIRDQKPNPLLDRKALDNIIFDILDLTQEERKEVYWAVCELVKNRLQKAKSV